MKSITALLQLATIVLPLFSISVYAASLDDEAKKVVKDYFINKKIGVICGDSFYLSMADPSNPNESGIKQSKEFSFNAKPQQVTYADNLNGIEWKGSGTVKEKAVRVYIPPQGWTPWLDGQENEILVLFRQNGKWNVDWHDAGVRDFFRDVKPINCKQIEALPK